MYDDLRHFDEKQVTTLLKTWKKEKEYVIKK